MDREFPIEQRSTREVTHIGGKQIAPTGVLLKIKHLT